MRSTLSIIVAVKDSMPVTEEELKMALLALSAVDHFRRGTIDRLSDAIEKKSVALGFLSAEAVKQKKFLMEGLQSDPIEFLGVGNIPGNPEYEDRMKFHKKIVKDATGIEL